MGSKYVADPLSRRNIREIVKMFQFDNDKDYPIVRLLELVLPKLIKDFELIILQKDELENSYAETDVSNKKIYVREDVYEGAIKGNGRDRFTLAHEVGHIIMHSGVQIYPNLKENLKSYNNPEWQANAFASELLIPHEKIKTLEINEIAKIYKVSKKAAGIAKTYC